MMIHEDAPSQLQQEIDTFRDTIVAVMETWVRRNTSIVYFYDYYIVLITCGMLNDFLYVNIYVWFSLYAFTLILIL